MAKTVGAALTGSFYPTPTPTPIPNPSPSFDEGHRRTIGVAPNVDRLQGTPALQSSVVRAPPSRLKGRNSVCGCGSAGPSVGIATS